MVGWQYFDFQKIEDTWPSHEELCVLWIPIYLFGVHLGTNFDPRTPQGLQGAFFVQLMDGEMKEMSYRLLHVNKGKINLKNLWN